MTTLAAPVLSDAQQMLIDARLDTIDRMLIGRVPREDRLAIVREVESQIQELLAARDAAAASREEILEVLRRLDPPEAYLPEDSEARDIPCSPRFVNLSAPMAVKSQPAKSRYGRLGGILGLASFGSLLLFPIIYFLVAIFESELLFILGFSALTLLGLASSITGLALSIRGRGAGVLPVLGIISSAIALPFYFFALLFTAYIVMNLL